MEDTRMTIEEFNEMISGVIEKEFDIRKCSTFKFVSTTYFEAYTNGLNFFSDIEVLEIDGEDFAEDAYIDLFYETSFGERVIEGIYAKYHDNAMVAYQDKDTKVIAMVFNDELLELIKSKGFEVKSYREVGHDT